MIIILCKIAHSDEEYWDQGTYWLITLLPDSYASKFQYQLTYKEYGNAPQYLCENISQYKIHMWPLLGGLGSTNQ